MLLKAKLNDIAQKMLWEEAANTCERVINNMATTGSTKKSIQKCLWRENEDHWFSIGFWTYCLRH